MIATKLGGVMETAVALNTPSHRLFPITSFLCVNPKYFNVFQRFLCRLDYIF